MRKRFEAEMYSRSRWTISLNDTHSVTCISFVQYLVLRNRGNCLCTRNIHNIITWNLKWKFL
jgi:hypothetical protein